MPKVFVPQQPSRFDNALRVWIPIMSLERARRYGDLVIMLPPGANKHHTAPLVAAIKDRMDSYGPEDCMVAVGDPTLIAVMAVIAAQKSGGLLRLLKWDRVIADYILVELKV